MSDQPQPGPRLPVATAEIDCSPAGYSGWVATAQTNPPGWCSDGVFSGDRQRIRECLPQAFIHWNFVGANGAPLPQPHEPGALDAVPADLHGYLLAISDLFRRRSA